MKGEATPQRREGRSDGAMAAITRYRSEETPMKLRLRGMIVTVAFGLFTTMPAVNAQPPATVARIGILRLAAGPSQLIEVFRQQLWDLGYVEGQNIVLEDRPAGGREDLLPELAAELSRQQVSVIFAAGHAAVSAAKQATSRVPIVMLVGGDPVGSGLITSLAQPGGNVTGVTGLSPRLSARRLELLKQIVPLASRVAVLLDPEDESKALDRQQLLVAARALAVRLHPVEVRSPSDLEPAFATMMRAQDEALITIGGASTLIQRRQIVQLAAKSRLPAIYESREFVEAGGLMSYGASIPHMIRRAAIYVDKILKGAKPSDLPVEQTATFELVINLQTAQALSLNIPPAILQQADQLIQ
jgi:putative tryptophan/tyrosine transport system substrate-binding protein